MCAFLCNQNRKCFSFQHNKQNQQCKTSTWNIYDVQNCDSVDNNFEAVYLKGMKKSGSTTLRRLVVEPECHAWMFKFLTKWLLLIYCCPEVVLVQFGYCATVHSE